MKLFQLVLSSTALFLASSSATLAEQSQTVTRAEIASEHCNDQWTSFAALQPNAWSELPAVEIDTGIDAATNQALNKYEAAAIALAEYFGAFVGFADEKNQNPAYFALAQARYDLAMCLVPTQPERELIVELARKANTAPDDKIRASLFKTFDRFDCMQVAKASEAIFSLDPTRQPFTFDFDAITSANMKACK